MNSSELLNFFTLNQFHFELYQHEPWFTVEQGKHIQARIKGAHSKNLFLKDKKKNYYLISVIENKKVDLKALAKTHSRGGFSFGSPEELMAMLKLIPGSVTSFALIESTAKPIHFILDCEFLDCEWVNFHPLQNDLTVCMAIKDFLNFFDKIEHPPILLTLPVTHNS